jgi:phospholipase/lecithinase/hemolysin
MLKHRRTRVAVPTLATAAGLLMFALSAPTAGAAPASAATPLTYSRVVVFGDSLSDPGNAFALLGATATPPDWTLNPFLIPSAPYARGGQNFTNGATWIERLARDLRVPATAGPAFRSDSPVASNYATGAARARDVGFGLNLQAQVGSFLQDVGGAAPADALYVIEIGGDDVRDALQAYQTGGLPAATTVIAAAIAVIQQQVTTLYGAGARHFLIWNSPDVSLTPAAHILDGLYPGTLLLGSALTAEFNTALAQLLPVLSGLLPTIDIVPFDAYELLYAIILSPGSVGLTNVTDACLTPNVPPFTCEHPDQFLFWDGIHPTTAAHALIAQAALAALVAP